MILDLKIKKDLRTNTIGKNIINLEKVDSTQMKAKELAENNIENGTLILTDNQYNGIGTHGRKWYMEQNKNIAFTLIIYPKCNLQNLNGFTKNIAECMLKAIYTTCNIQADIKKPNDIMLNNKKIGGILTQVISKGEKIKYILVGIGMDVNSSNFPEYLEEIATSLKKEFGEEYSREAIISEFCNIFENYCIKKKII